MRDYGQSSFLRRSGVRRLVSILLASGIAIAVTVQMAAAQEIQTILEECGQTKSIQKLQHQLDATVSSAVESTYAVSTATREQISKKLRGLLANDSLVRRYQHEFAELGVREKQEIYRWCLSPTGRKIIEAEEKESPDDDPESVIERALLSIRTARNPESRRDSIIQVINGSRLSTLMPESIGVVATLHLAAEELGKTEEKRLSHADFVAALIGLGREMQRDLKPFFEAMIVDSYADLSDDDLAAYVLFLKSVGGKAWTEATYLALHGYLGASVRTIVDATVSR